MDITKEIYRKVLRALASGPKSSEQIQMEIGFPTTDHCSATLAKLSRNGYISRGYALTEEGRRALHPGHNETPQTPESPIFPPERFATKDTIPPKPFTIRVIRGLPSVVRESD
jgi:hypothetical protein